MRKTFLLTNYSKFLALAVSLALVLTLVVPGTPAEAASLLNLSNTMTSQTVSATSSHTMRFITPTGAGTSTATIVITFPASFDFTGKLISTVSFTHGASTGLESTEALSAAPSATNWGAVFSGTSNRILTLTPPTDGVGAAVVAPNDRMIVTYSSANSVNPTTPGSYTTSISGAFGDAGDMTNVILSNNQINIDAVVTQALVFTLSTTTISFGTLNSAAARFASSTAAGSATEVEAHNIVVGTNAVNGYTMTASGTTLTYGSSTIDAIGSTNTASTVGTEQFGLRAVAAGGIGAVAVPYAAAGFAYATSSFPSAVATAVGASSNTTYSVRYLANIRANTEAGVYTGAVQYLTTANF